MSSNEERNCWAAYYDAVRSSPPRPTLTRALDVFGAKTGHAIDLGCGAGRDALALLARGWTVLAIDREPEALARLQAACPPEPLGRLTTRRAAFEDLADLPPSDLINASYSLPFCAPAHFDAAWELIVGAIAPGGLFSGHFFGDRDSWAANPGMTFHAREELDARLRRLTVISLDERDEEGQTALGETKHWHVFSVVARRGASNPASATGP